MATEKSGPPWLGLAKFAWIVIFALLLYSLGRAMVRDHFLRGGQDNNNWHDDLTEK
jgi:hypothetical protein